MKDNQKNQSGLGKSQSTGAAKDAQGKSTGAQNLKDQGKDRDLSSRQEVKGQSQGLGYDTDAKAGQADRSRQSEATGRGREESEIKGAAGRKSTLGNMKEEDSDLDELDNPRA